MRFVLDVTLGDTRAQDTPGGKGDPAAELARVLRYWAGNLHHYPLEPGTGAAVYDSAHREIGHWRVDDTDA